MSDFQAIADRVEIEALRGPHQCRQALQRGAVRRTPASLIALIALIALINATNRPAVITRQAGSDYQPGQFGYQQSPVWKERHECSV